MALTATNGTALNRLGDSDRAVHDWYRFVLSFPPHLVREYLDRFGADDQMTLLDPFCGTGTTLTECKKLGIPSLGIEANPVAHLASLVKVDWSPDPDGLLAHSSAVAEAATAVLEESGLHDLVVAPGRADGLRSLPPEKMALLLRDSISPLPLHRALVLLDALDHLHDERFHRHQLIALASVLVNTSSNLKFGPEVGVTRPKADAPVIAPWQTAMRAMADDLRVVADRRATPSTVHCADSRSTLALLPPESIGAVFTSPPYPNEKDYTRTTRLELVLLGLVQDKADLRRVKKTLVRSNTRGVYSTDVDDEWVEGHAEVQRLATAIEERRIALGKTSGFERLYHRVTKLYFGGMARHLADLRPALRPGAQLGYVVGDQASYLQVMIRTGAILADIAERLGYQVLGVDLFRSRLATATGDYLREEVVVLKWPGG